jgi:hypothetical protein
MRFLVIQAKENSGEDSEKIPHYFTADEVGGEFCRQWFFA